jgi:hypothetical protein
MKFLVLLLAVVAISAIGMFFHYIFMCVSPISAASFHTTAGELFSPYNFSVQRYKFTYGFTTLFERALLFAS